MKYNEINNLDKTNYLDKYNLARMFEVVQRGKNSYFNICKTIRFQNMDEILPKYFTIYEVKPKDTWTNLSFKFFNTYKLWWLLCKFNNVEDPFSELKQGDFIKVPTQQVVRQIIQNLDVY